MSAAIRQTWQVNLRYVRFLARQPAFLGITLTQPIIWLLLFGALFKAVTQIPGFHGDSYVDFLTPGVVVMLAVSSAGWTGMGFIEDINAGRHGPSARLAGLARRPEPGQRRLRDDHHRHPDGAHRPARLAAGRPLRQRHLGRPHPHPRGGAARRGLRLALQRRRDAGSPARDAHRGGQPRPASADLPVLRADAAEPRARLDPHGRPSSTRSTGPWRPGARRRWRRSTGASSASRVGLLVGLVVLCAWFATRAFATYQRSL